VWEHEEWKTWFRRSDRDPEAPTAATAS